MKTAIRRVLATFGWSRGDAALQQRAREFSVRRALGATGGDVLRLVMREGVMLVIVGLAIGLAAADALARVAPF